MINHGPEKYRMKELIVIVLLLGLIFSMGCVTTFQSAALDEEEVEEEVTNVSADIVDVGSDLSEIITSI